MFRYEWRDGLNSVQMSPDVSLPQFVVIGHRQRQIEVSLSSGNYSRLLADVQFTRSMGYYMIQVYIPSSLIVVMSWVSFWLNRGAGNEPVLKVSDVSGVLPICSPRSGQSGRDHCADHDDPQQLCQCCPA